MPTPTASTSARTTRRPQTRGALVGPDRIVGRSTHAPAQADAAQADPDVDYLAVGPVHETPTKPGRPAAGLDYVAYAARTVTKPWFAIGGLDASNVDAVLDRGARADRRGAGDRRRRRSRGGRPSAGAAPWRDTRVSAGPARRRASRRAPARRRETNGREAMARGYARARESDDALRAALEPIKPGEKPWPIVASVILAVSSAVANVILVLAGWDGETSCRR